MLIILVVNPFIFILILTVSELAIIINVILITITKHLVVQSEIQMVSEGGELCINIDFEPPILAFWPREIGSARNCYCSVLFRDFSDCYCISLQLTEYTVIFNTSTSELCWKNLNFAMNGSIVGIVREESPDCGDQPHLTARTYLKIIVILVEENISTSVSSSIIGKLL